MKRLYYLTDDIDVAERISDRLHEQGVANWNFHVLGHDKAKIVRHNLHGTTVLHELDIVRSGERGVLIGIIVGILVTNGVVFFTDFGNQANWMVQVASVLLFTGFGAWVGGLVGIQNENYKIRRFRKNLENGDYLLLIDVSRGQRQDVEGIISEFSGVRRAGEDSILTTPFSWPIIR
ncbi:MAG: hypothetical protein ACI82Z_000129 [Cellvibrionaceae bacterium]|jgi:hypothetical protein